MDILHLAHEADAIIAEAPIYYNCMAAQMMTAINRLAQLPAQQAGQPVEFDLKSVQPLDSGGLYLRYLAKNVKTNE